MPDRRARPARGPGQAAIQTAPAGVEPAASARRSRGRERRPRAPPRRRGGSGCQAKSSRQGSNRWRGWPALCAHIGPSVGISPRPNARPIDSRGPGEARLPLVLAILCSAEGNRYAPVKSERGVSDDGKWLEVELLDGSSGPDEVSGIPVVYAALPDRTRGSVRAVQGQAAFELWTS